MADCPICLDEKNKNKIIKLDCGHQFHFDCIIKIKNNACPLCRQILTDETLCEGGHFTYFNTSFINKKGKCNVCRRKTLKYVLREKLTI